jgi:hypothetical protein
VEASRRHGPFDTRWPCGRKESSDAAPTAARLRAAEAAEALGWDAFSSRYFRERRRHDSEARSAYAAYKQGREWRTTPARLSLVPTEHVPTVVEREPEEGGTRRLLAAIAAGRARSEPTPIASAATRSPWVAPGVRSERPEKIVQLGGAEVATDAALRDVQRERRDIDAEIELRRSGLGASVGRAVRRARADR